MKKAELSIYLMFSVIITVIGITLVLLFIGSNQDVGKKMYCQAFYDAENSRDEFCEEYLKFGVSSLVLRTENTKKFTSGREIEHVVFPSGDLTQTIHLRLPVSSRIRKGEMNLAISELSQNQFKDGPGFEKYIFGQAEHTEIEPLVNLPNNALITDASFEVSGQRYPAKAQIVFAIDSSPSMKNEWRALCEIIESIQDELLDIGIQLILNAEGSVDVFSIGAGTASGHCMTHALSEEQMETRMNLVTFGEVSEGHINSYPPSDDYNEAWAVATSWLAHGHNYNWEFSSDVKRIIIPISDSDPTGAKWTICKNECSHDSDWDIYSPEFSGSETSSIQMAIDDATNPPSEHIFVIPIYGDNKGTAAKEGFGVGSGNCVGKCSEIIGWMNQLAIGTAALQSGESVSGFQDEDTILETVLDVLNSDFPKYLKVDIARGAATLNIWDINYELNDQNSPLVLSDNQKQDLVNFISNNCIGNTCELHTTSRDSGLLVDKIRIKYMQDPRISKIIIGDPANSITITGLDLTNPSQKIDIGDVLAEAINSYCSPVTDKYCDIPIKFYASNEGALDVQINVDYSYYDLEKDIASKIVECWQQSLLGQSDKDFICEEFVVGDNYNYAYPIDEEMITKILMSRNYCDILGNIDKDHLCGTEDNLRFEQDLIDTKNILIEYVNDPVDGPMVVVS